MNPSYLLLVLPTCLLCMNASVIKSFTLHVLSNLIGKCSEYFSNKGIEQSSSSKHGWPKSIRQPKHSALTGSPIVGLKAFLVVIVSRFDAFIQLLFNPMTSTQKGTTPPVSFINFKTDRFCQTKSLYQGNWPCGVQIRLYILVKLTPSLSFWPLCSKFSIHSKTRELNNWQLNP